MSNGTKADKGAAGRDAGQVFDAVLKKSIELGASDIHVTAGSPYRVRIDGNIKVIHGTPPLKPSETAAIAGKVLLAARRVQPDEVPEAVRALSDLDVSYGLQGVGRFRVNICSQRGSVSLVLRNIPMGVPDFDSLHLPPVLREIAAADRGLVLVTGITGSGKTTTLASMIDFINRTRSVKIVTIEDPIEYLHKDQRGSVVQREVGTDTSDFATAMRAALRQDPDVIMVGEMRDRETTEIALKAAETGHLVLSTLHTSGAVKTINRIIGTYEMSDQEAVRVRLAENVTAILGQRLVPRVDGKGRTPAVEIMRSTLGIQECILSPDRTDHILDLVEKGHDQYGTQSFDQHLARLLSEGVISFDVAKAAATSPANFERNVHFT